MTIYILIMLGNLNVVTTQEFFNLDSCMIAVSQLQKNHRFNDRVDFMCVKK